MSKRSRKNAHTQMTSTRNTWLYGFAGAVLIIAAAILLLRTKPASAHEHPAPRPNADQITTEDAARYGAYPEAREIYTMAAQIRSTLDGLFCYCYCKGSGHYSLLDCFRDDHGAGCDICLGEARLAYQMQQQGASLDQIRAAIDAQFGPA